MLNGLVTEHYELSDLQRQALDYWQSLQGPEGELPARAHLDVLDIPGVMPNVVIFDVLDDPQDFRYRLVGTKITENTFGDYTGKTLRQMEGKGPGSKIWSLLEQVAGDRRILFEEVPYVGPKKELLRSTLLFLPLANPGQPVNMILLTVAFHRQ